MGIIKSLFQKKASSCCNVKIEEVKEEAKVDQANVKKIVAASN